MQLNAIPGKSPLHVKPSAGTGLPSPPIASVAVSKLSIAWSAWIW